jgi:putative ABC transport system substrate-binding protein
MARGEVGGLCPLQDLVHEGGSPLLVEQPTEIKLVVNVKVAKALGLTVPLSLLNRADEVIE